MRKILLGLMSIAILATGCSKDEMLTGGDTGNGNGENEKGSINIAIKGENAAIRAIGDPTPEQEKTVKSFTVYVFNNSTGVLETSKTFNGVLEGNITGLSVVSQKKVVVFVNQPDLYPTITNYSDFENASTMISLATQVPGNFSVTGLFMSGENPTPVQLKTDETVSVSVTVKRVVAKVKLGALTVTPESGLSLDDFNLKGVSIQRARDKASVFGGLRSDGFNYVGGLLSPNAGEGEVAPDFLRNDLTLPQGYIAGTRLSPDVYYYVFPNDNSTNQATMLTLYGTYLNEPMYYSFLINNTTGSTTDGTWIQRNKVYTLNVHLKKIGSGGEDPNIPDEEVSMDVDIDVADWEDELIQDIEW